jgi:nicotinate dehydrogenase subunit B
MAPASISRRQLLQGAGALIVSFSIPGPALRVSAQSAATGGRPDAPDATSLDSWLAIGQDEAVTVFTSKVELGTGTETALAQIVADELDVEFKQIRMEAGDTDKTVDQAATVGSRTLERAGPQLRQAAAAARQELLKLASARLQTPVDRLAVTGGMVSVVGDPSKTISYGTLIGNQRFNVRITATGAGWDMKIAPEARAKDPKTYRVVGTSVPRTDLPGKFTGEFAYVHDVRVPGMLHGRVVRPPSVNGKPTNVDESSIKQIPGIVKVVQEGSFVGVVAETEWAAIRAAKALNVTWSTPATKMPASADEVYAYLKDTKSYQDQVAANNGDADAAISRAATTFEATYKWPFQLHGMLGPSCAVADVRPDRATSSIAKARAATGA